MRKTQMVSFLKSWRIDGKIQSSTFLSLYYKDFQSDAQQHTARSGREKLSRGVYSLSWWAWTKLNLYTVTCNLYSVLCKLYSILCASYCVLCTLYFVLCTTYSICFNQIVKLVTFQLLAIRGICWIFCYFNSLCSNTSSLRFSFYRFRICDDCFCGWCGSWCFILCLDPLCVYLLFHCTTERLWLISMLISLFTRCIHNYVQANCDHSRRSKPTFTWISSPSVSLLHARSTSSWSWTEIIDLYADFSRTWWWLLHTITA